jgi:hypothetical protein
MGMGAACLKSLMMLLLLREESVAVDMFNNKRKPKVKEKGKKESGVG